MNADCVAVDANIAFAKRADEVANQFAGISANTGAHLFRQEVFNVWGKGYDHGRESSLVAGVGKPRLGTCNSRREPLFFLNLNCVSPAGTRF